MYESALRPATTADGGSWVRDRLQGTFGQVTLHVPSGFEAYTRIFHPVSSWESGLVRWADAADGTGRVMHPLAQWQAISVPVPGTFSEWDSYGDKPTLGNLDPADLNGLVDVLSQHAEPDDGCTFAVWEGYGWIAEAHSTVSVESRSNVQLVDPGYPVTRPVRGLDMSGARLALPGRRYVLWTGEIHAALKIGDWPREDWFIPQSPNLMWPSDRSWCVATEIDFDSTLVGGSRALVDAILASDVLEAREVAPTDSLASDADVLNRDDASR